MLGSSGRWRPGNEFMSNRLISELANVFHLNRRGHLFVTADPARIPVFRRAAEEAAELGAGPARYHTGQPHLPPYVPAPAYGFEDQPTGADVILDPALLQQPFPYLSTQAIAVVHARRAGWFSAQQLGMMMLESARERGARLLEARVEKVQMNGGRVQSVHLGSKGRPMTVSTRHFVNAAGPFLKDAGQMVEREPPPSWTDASRGRLRYWCAIGLWLDGGARFRRAAGGEHHRERVAALRASLHVGALRRCRLPTAIGKLGGESGQI